jgi:hypothetical protein
MRSFFQNPSCAQKCKEKQHIFTKLHSPYGWTVQKIPCNDFVALNPHHGEDKKTSYKGQRIYEMIKEGIEFFHLHYPHK